MTAHLSTHTALAASDVVALWEWGQRRSSADRALAMLQAAHPERAWDDLARLSIGQRDALLVELHSGTFGPTLQAQVSCPDCGAPSDFQVECRRLLLSAPSFEPDERPREVELAGRVFRFRLPNSHDLARIAGEGDPEVARRALVSGCVLGDEPLDEGLSARIGAAMLEADPQSHLQLEMRCPSCECAWLADLHAEDFLWRMVERLARRYLREVQQLARAYGWQEAEILAMSAERRGFYLEALES